MKTEKVNYTQFIIVSVIAFAIFLSNQMVVNTVTKYASTMMASAQMLGFLGGMWGLAALVTRPFAGQVVDNESHKPLLFSCIAVLVLSNIILIFANNIYILLVSRAINGIAWGFGSTVCMTTACDSLPKNKLSSGIGIYTLMQTLAQVIGPSIALEIIDHSSFHTLFLTTTAIMVVAMLLAFMFKTGHKKAVVRKYAFSLHSMFAPKAFIPAAVLMCNTMQVSAVAAFLLLYADSMGITGLSFFFTLQALSIICTRPFVAKFINTKNHYQFTIISELLIIAGLVNLFFARNIISFIISALCFGLGKSGAQPALTGMCISAVPQNERGRASNTSYTFQDLGQIFGSNLAGIFAGILGYGGAFLCIGGVVATFLLIFILAYMLPNQKRIKGNTV